MESINRFLYGPTPQERVRSWHQKLRQEQRVVDREIRQVRGRWTAKTAEALSCEASWKPPREKHGSSSSSWLARETARMQRLWRGRSYAVTSRRIGCMSQRLGWARYIISYRSNWVCIFAIYPRSVAQFCGTPAMMKVTGALQKSTEIMKLSNDLIKIPQISATMREMSMEMTKVHGLLQNLHLHPNQNAGGYHGGDAGRHTRRARRGPRA